MLSDPHGADRDSNAVSAPYAIAPSVWLPLLASSLRQRTAIELLKLRELSLKEAAQASGMSIGALKVSVHRAIKSLRARLDA